MTRSAWIMAGAWLALCCAAVLTGMALRLSPVEQQVIQPGFLAPLLAPLALAAAAIAAALLWVATGQARGLQLQGPLAELVLYFPLVFAYVWLVLPAKGLRLLDGAVLAGFLVVGGWLVIKSPRPAGTGGQKPAQTRPVDLALILLPVILGLAGGVRPDWQSSGVSALFYPAYALVQLAVFLIIPAVRLNRLGLTNGRTALFCAAVFSLAHAPNPVVAGVTFLAMFLWTRQFLAGRRLWQLALVMGLSATTFSQFLSDDFTGHMRVGPGYLRTRAVEALGFAEYSPEQIRPRAFLRLIYPETVGRQASAAELDLWEELIARARRTTMAWQFFISDEYARKSQEQNWPAPPPPAVHWTSYPPEWRQRITAFDSDEYWARCGGDFPGFTKCLYRDILHRQCSSQELATWNDDLTVGQRLSLAAVLLKHGQSWRSSAFPGLTVQELLFSR